MPRKMTLKQKISKATYDKQSLNKTALNLKRSIDEVNKVLDSTGKKNK